MVVQKASSNALLSTVEGWGVVVWVDCVVVDVVDEELDAVDELEEFRRRFVNSRFDTLKFGLVHLHVDDL